MSNEIFSEIINQLSNELVWYGIKRKIKRMCREIMQINSMR